MSRIGNKLITVPAGVTVEVAAGNEVTVKGPKGSLTRTFSSLMEIHVEDNVVTVKRPNDEKHTKQLHGTTRALLHNMVVGVSEGFTKDLELVGIGFRTAMKGNVLTLNVGYSHQVEMPVKEGLEVTCPTATTIKVAGIDKQEVGEFAAMFVLFVDQNLTKERVFAMLAKSSVVRKVKQQVRNSSGKGDQKCLLKYHVMKLVYVVTNVYVQKLAELQNAHVYAYSEVTHTSMFKSLMMLTKTHWSVLQVLT